MIRKNRSSLSIVTILLAGLVVSCSEREDVTQYAPTETYPDDNTLDGIASKKAMIVIAHDDDMCAMTGTISMLNKKGWDIRVISIRKDEDRNEAHRKACSRLLDSVMFFNFDPAKLRIEPEDGQNLYDAIPKDQFEKVFNRPLVEQEIQKKINQFQPSVIFTLDSEMGGYGHPEHVFISQLVVDLAKADSIQPEYIYQSVYTDHMEKTIMARHSKRMKSWGFPGDGWERAKAAYNTPEGMPEPTVQINITSEAQAKMNYLKSYNKRERKTMGFFIPAFEFYSAEEYFNIFDREFYRVIKL